MNERTYLLQQARQLVALYAQHGRHGCNGAYARQAHAALITLLCKGVQS